MLVHLFCRSSSNRTEKRVAPEKITASSETGKQMILLSCQSSTSPHNCLILINHRYVLNMEGMGSQFSIYVNPMKGPSQRETTRNSSTKLPMGRRCSVGSLRSTAGKGFFHSSPGVQQAINPSLYSVSWDRLSEFLSASYQLSISISYCWISEISSDVSQSSLIWVIF